MSTTDLSDPLQNDGWIVALHNVWFKNEGEKPDHEWIPIVAAKGYIIITSDRKMATWRAENGRVRQVIEDCRAKVFFLRGVASEQIKAITSARVRIARHVKQCAGTYLFARIHGPGSRLGEVQILSTGGATKEDRKFGHRPDTSGDVA
jgi:hypothetical protein